MTFDYSTYQKQAMTRKAYIELRELNPRHDLLDRMFENSDGIFEFAPEFLEANARDGNLSQLRLYAKYAADLRDAILAERKTPQ